MNHHISNLEILSKNVSTNNLSDIINIIPIPLTNFNDFAKFNMSNTSIGSALSSFDADFDANGNKFISNFYYRTLGCSLDSFNVLYNFQQPNYIKIDVDGIEHLILSGGKKNY